VNQITINLSETTYQRLLAVAQTHQKSPEEWLAGQVTSNLAHSPATATEACQIAAAFLAKHVGILLVPQHATLNSETEVWNVSVIPNVKMTEPTPVGEIRVDAQSGKVRTPVSEIATMIRRRIRAE
jgi:hypothetical protein